MASEPSAGEPSRARSRSPSGDADKEKGDGAPTAKKQKFSRSRTACFQCRQRKSRCGARPPDPCPNCVEAELPCTWPTEDGRSSKARLQRYRNAQYGGSAAGSAARNTPDLKPDLAEGWLDRLLAGDPGPSRGNGAYATAPPLTASTSEFITPSVQTNFAFTPMPSAPAYQSAPILPGSLFGQIAAPQVDPAQFVWAVSSRLPTVEDASPNDERSVASDPSPATATADAVHRARVRKGTADDGGGGEGKIVKVSWWRPHGQTAIAPGLKKVTLKVRVHAPQDSWAKTSSRASVSGAGATDAPQDLIAPDGAPPTPIMRHLLDVFMTHFGCQFPFIDRADLEAKIEARTASVFLLLSIAAIAARFSNHPAIALPHLQPYEYGNQFYARAKALLGSMLGVPSREAVAAFVLLAHMGFAADSESEVWMMTGLAVRMSIDAGLHLNPPDDSAMSPEDRRLNRLVFWSVLLMDYALAFGVGRQTTFRPEDITQTLPTVEDLNPASASTPTAATATPRSPFPFAAKMMLSYGPLINLLNRGRGGDRDIYAARAAAIKLYNALPPDMQWNVANLQRHSQNNQGSIFLHLHLWMHTILASEFLTGANVLRRGDVKTVPGLRSGAATPTTLTTSSLWRNSVRTIGDILVLSDIINPHAYFALPFVNQAWFVAGCCYVKEIEMHAATASRPASRAASPKSDREEEGEDAASADDSASDASGTSDAPPAPPVDMSRALLTSVATTNINTLKSGLEKLARYWYGAEWIAGTLQQRIAGMHDVDLVSVRENFASYVSLPDAGAARSGAVAGGTAALADADADQPNAHPDTLAPVDMAGLDFLSLPFDLSDGGSANVTEQDVPIPHVFPYPVS